MVLETVFMSILVCASRSWLFMTLKDECSLMPPFCHFTWASGTLFPHWRASTAKLGRTPFRSVPLLSYATPQALGTSPLLPRTVSSSLERLGATWVHPPCLTAWKLLGGFACWNVWCFLMIELNDCLQGRKTKKIEHHCHAIHQGTVSLNSTVSQFWCWPWYMAGGLPFVCTRWQEKEYNFFCTICLHKPAYDIELHVRPGYCVFSVLFNLE